MGRHHDLGRTMTWTGPDPTGVAHGEIADRVAAAVGAVGGISLLVPLRAQAIRWAGSDSAMAVSVGPEGIEVRLVAHRLPLPPLLDEVAAAIQDELTGAGRPLSPLRLIVVELTTQAFEDST